MNNKPKSSFARKGQAFLAGLIAAGVTTVMHAQATAADVVEDVQGITATTTTGYVAAAALGVAAMVVGTLVYFLKKGWRLR